MKRLAILVAALLAASAVAFSVTADQEAKPDSNQLIGTWTLVSAKYGGQEAGFPVGMTMVKHVTPEQFMWARYDQQGQVSDSAGGSHEIKGDTYTATPQYGTGADFDSIKGKTHPFRWKVEGKRWHHEGKLASGLTIEEVWERVEKK